MKFLAITLALFAVFVTINYMFGPLVMMLASLGLGAACLIFLAVALKTYDTLQTKKVPVSTRNSSRNGGVH
jgi:hypothetical protein